MTFWNGIGIGFCAGIFATLSLLLAYALCSVSPPEPDLSWMGDAERKYDDTPRN